MARVLLLLGILLTLIVGVVITGPGNRTTENAGRLLGEPVESSATEFMDVEQTPPQRINLGVGGDLDFGSLEVQVLDQDDLLLQDAFDVSVIPDNALKRADTWKGRTQNGRAVFTQVDFDHNFTVKVISESGAQMAVVRAPGPTQDQRKAVFILHPTFQKAVILGRILHENGNVESNRGFDCVQRIHEDSNFRELVSHLRTDDDGRFHYPIEHLFVIGSTRTLTLIQRGTRSQPERHIQIDLSSAFESGEHDLGDFIMTNAPVLGRGRITDTAGAPVVGASVVLQIGLPSKHALWLDSLATDDSQLVWRRLHGTEVTTNESGGFLLHGSMPTGRYRISVTQESFLPGELEIALGTSGMDLTLLRAWTIVGRCVFDKEEKPNAMYVGILPANDPDQIPSEEQAASLETDGAFELSDQAEGAHTLVVRALGAENNLLTMPLVLGPEGGVLHMEDIDMRGQFRTITLIVKQENGIPVFMPLATTLDGTLVATSIRSPLLIRTKEASLDLSVKAFQLRSSTVHNLNEDYVITLRKGLVVRVILDNPPTIPPGWLLIASVHPVSSNQTWAPGTSPWRWVSSGLTSALSDPGVYELRMMMMSSGTSRRGMESKSILLGESGSWPRFQVEDVSGTQVVHVTLDKHAVDQALRKAMKTSE